MLEKADKAGLDVGEGVSGIELLPPLPSEHCRGVHDADALKRLIDRGVEHRVPSGKEHRPWILASLSGRLGRDTDARAHRPVGSVEHLFKERGFVGEVVVQRGAGHATATDHTLGAGLVIPALAEQLGRHRDEPVACGPPSVDNDNTICTVSAYSLYGGVRLRS